MFGIAATFRVPVENEGVFRAVYLRENATYCASLEGFVAEHLLQPPDPDAEWVSLAIFSEVSYRAWTTGPAIDAIYQKLFVISGEEPRWYRGTIMLNEARTVPL